MMWWVTNQITVFVSRDHNTRIWLVDISQVTYPVYKAMERLQAKQEKKDTSTPRAQMVMQSSETISWQREKSRENNVYREYIIDNKVQNIIRQGLVISESDRLAS